MGLRAHHTGFGRFFFACAIPLSAHRFFNRCFAHEQTQKPSFEFERAASRIPPIVQQTTFLKRD
jgi:hypothetical protein